MIYKFTDFAYDTYEQSETAWRLNDEFDWPEEVAERFAANHKPMYEVKGEFEYDSDTDTVKTIALVLNGARFVPEGV